MFLSSQQPTQNKTARDLSGMVKEWGNSRKVQFFFGGCNFSPKTPSVLCRKWHGVRLGKIPENAILRFMAARIVSFVDLDGIRHSVELEAEGLDEAGVFGIVCVS
jgi:hypothetical protein